MTAVFTRLSLTLSSVFHQHHIMELLRSQSEVVRPLVDHLRLLVGGDELDRTLARLGLLDDTLTANQEPRDCQTTNQQPSGGESANMELGEGERTNQGAGSSRRTNQEAGDAQKSSNASARPPEEPDGVSCDCCHCTMITLLLHLILFGQI